MILVLCAALLTASSSSEPPSTAPPSSSAPRLLVLDPKPGAVSAEDAAALQRLLIAELSRAKGVVVVAASDVVQLAELGRKQQLAGCETDACLAEIAGAMGAELLVISELAQLGDRQIWQLSLFDQQRGSILARATVQADDVASLADGIPDACATLLDPVAERGVVAGAANVAGGLFVGSAVVAASGAVVGVVGAIGVVGSAVVFGDPTYSTELRRSAQEASPALLGTAIVGGAVAVVGGIGMGIAWLVGE